MGTLDQKQYTTNFSGLTSTAVTAVVFIGVSLTLEEALKRLRRYGSEDKARSAGVKGVRERGMEGWAMGYLFRARSFVAGTPTEQDYSRWPLVWIWRAIRTQESFFVTHCGGDAASYVRFLRCCFWWLLVMACTVFPVLTSVNFIYSPDKISTLSIDRASVESLIQSDNGRGLLWVHVVCIWFVSVSWMVTMGFFGFGVVHMRRNALRERFKAQTNRGIAGSEKSVGAVSGKPTAIPDIPAQDVGWRYRTVLVRNIPVAMRSENAIREYFEAYLGYSDDLSHPEPSAPTRSNPKPFPNLGLLPQSHSAVLIQDIVLVRKQGELNDLWNKYQEALWQLESAHTALIQNLMAWVKVRVKIEEKPEQLSGASRPWWRLWRTKEEKEIDRVAKDLEKEACAGDEVLLAAFRDFLPGAKGTSDATSGESRSIWEVTADVPPKLLDRFQPLFKLKHFRGQAVPAIDYWLAKLNLTQRLIEEHRSRPDSAEPASTAFVTFTKAADARRARHELPSRPGEKTNWRNNFECKVSWAPEVRDLDWNKLVYMSLSTDIVRGLILQIFIWAATIFWVIPISFLVGLLSLSSIAKYIPRLAKFLETHPATNSLFSNLLPTSIVALLGMLVPTLIGILTRKFQTFTTESKLLLEVQARYWKWMIFNILLVFCVGLTAFTAVLNAFKQPGSVLIVIANAFPKAATFFVSWSLLVIGVHHGVQHALIGIPYINHATIRKLKSPRKREIESVPRFFSYHYWIPNHLLVLAVTAVFAILNPMVIPFNFAYFSFANVVFKNQFAHVYYRRCFEGNGRAVFRRIFRYSLDSFLVAQVVAIAFFEVLKFYRLGGAVIPLLPITLFTKLIGTRLFELLMEEIDDSEALLICGEDAEDVDLSIPLESLDDGGHHRLGSAVETIKIIATKTMPEIIKRHREASTSARSVTSRHTASQRSLNETYNSPTSMESARPMLSPVYAHHLAPVSAPLEPKNLAHQQKTQSEKTLEHTSAGSLTTPHPPVIRDDRPVDHLHYDNPALVAPLADTLWLPRDPLIPVDLGDTIDFHGRALVSSEGGQGIIGHAPVTEIFENVTISPPSDVKTGANVEDRSSTEVLAASALSPTAQLLANHQSLDGTERIRVASEVATRVDEDLNLAALVSRRRPTRQASGSRTSNFESDSQPVPRRRNTNQSTLSAAGSMLLSESPQGTPPAVDRPAESPTWHRHPLEPRPSPPGIPSFEPPGKSQLASGSGASPAIETTQEHQRVQASPAGYGFPKPSSIRSGTSRAARQQRSSSSIGFSAGRDRSASAATGWRLSSIISRQSIAEGAEDQDVVEVSQAAAVLSELLEEERRLHEQRTAEARKRASVERADQRSGWFKKLIVGNADNAEVSLGQ